MFWKKPPRRVVATGHIGGEYGEIAAITYPLMEKYASLHGCEFTSQPLVQRGSRAASWLKLERIASCLVDCDEVLWLDADVVIADSSRSIFQSFTPGSLQAVADVTATPERHLNFGVWALRRPMLPYLVAAAMSDEFTNHSWWEQAAMIHLTKLHYIPTCVLGEEWNSWIGTPSHITPKFYHGCGLQSHERIAKIKEWAQHAN